MRRAVVSARRSVGTHSGLTHPIRPLADREELGVPIRVEIGPQDVKKGSCVVAVAGEAGTVAQKTTVHMSERHLVPHVRKALKAAGVETKAPEKKSKASSSGTEEEDKEDSEAESGSEESEEEEGGEAGSDDEERAASGAAAGAAGGDDMDDFDLEVDAEEDALTLNKKDIAKKKRKEERDKKKMQKRIKQAKVGSLEADAAEAARALAEEEAKAKKSSKKAKVVSF